ncbi:MAG: amidohydrolase family protein [Actinomycetota bacterium]|nr:amidohydrolase family protein [Actinomycetota bacterium]
MSEQFVLPGFVNAHSHAFQRRLRGRAEGGDFWAWREVMLDLARGLTPRQVRLDYAATYREMRAAGYTAVGEFHYLGFREAEAALAAAEEADIAIVLLYVAYARGGLARFRQPSVAAYLAELERLRERGRVGLAPHSVRACPPGWLDELGRYAEREELVLHVHADEQPREVDECLAEHGLRPIELLARTKCLGPRTTVVHATHADDGELDLLADSGARICVCPTTEANLGDGFLPVARTRRRGIELCIGSDSNVRIDPLEELRELEGVARRQELRRNVIEPDELLAIGADAGAASLGLGEWQAVEVDLAHPSLTGVARDDVRAALVFGCAADVVACAR